MVGVESFWPETAGGWVGLVGGTVGVMTGAAVMLGWVWPWVRRRLQLSSVQDIRVQVAAVIGLKGATTDPDSRCIRVRVENHSNQDFCLSAVTLHQGGPDGVGLWPERDHATQQLNNGATVKARDSHDFYIPILALLETQHLHRLRYAVAHDKLGRRYLSPRKQLTEAIYESLVSTSEVVAGSLSDP